MLCVVCDISSVKFIQILIVDLPQVDSMNFRVEYVRLRSGRVSDKDAGGQLFSLEGFSFAFHAKNEEWRDLKLVSQITFGSNGWQKESVPLRYTKIIKRVCISPASIKRANLFTMY